MSQLDLRERVKLDAPWLGAALGIYLAYTYVKNFGLGVDARAYWLAARGPLYSGAPATYDAYLYSPLFVQLIQPLASLDWPIFLSMWMILSASVFVYLLKPLGWRLAVPCFAMCLPEIVSGNVNWLLALVVAFAFRQPWLWAFPFITKITPTLGPLWFLVRREWKPFIFSVISIVVIVGISVTIDVKAWIEWLTFLESHLGLVTTTVGGKVGTPAFRIPIAVVLIIWGALTNRLWTLPAAMFLAAPVFGIAALSIFAGLPRLRDSQQQEPKPNSLV